MSDFLLNKFVDDAIFDFRLFNFGYVDDSAHVVFLQAVDEEFSEITFQNILFSWKNFYNQRYLAKSNPPVLLRRIHNILLSRLEKR